MGKRPKLESLEHLFKAGASFTLTDIDYEKETGASLPKEKNYLIKKSALAKWAADRGFVIVDVHEEASIKRVLTLEKK